MEIKGKMKTSKEETMRKEQEEETRSGKKVKRNTSDRRSESLSLNLDQICVSIYVTMSVCPFGGKMFPPCSRQICFSNCSRQMRVLKVPAKYFFKISRQMFFEKVPAKSNITP